MPHITCIASIFARAGIKAFTSHRVPFHYGCHGDAHTAAPRLSALHSIPAPSCSLNLRRPAKCDETTPCRTEASATRHRSRAAPGRNTRSRLLLAPYFARRQKDASQNGVRLRIVRRGKGKTKRLNKMVCYRNQPTR